MFTSENIGLILQIATLLGIIFAIYSYFRKPQEQGEINDKVFDVKFDALEKTVINLRDNHIHSIAEKLDKHISESQDIALRSAERMGGIEAKIDILLSNK